MKRKIIVFAGFILMTLIFSMFRCGCKPYNYSLDSIDAGLKRITGTHINTVYNYPYYALEDIYSQDDTVAIAFDSLAIEVWTKYSTVYAFNRNLPGIQSAYATSIRIIYEKITDIIITSNKDYSAEYPSGSNLKGLISVIHSLDMAAMTVDNMIEMFSLYDGWQWDYSLLYTFNTPPDTEEVHDITIIYKTEKNQEFTAVVKNVKILK